MIHLTLKQLIDVGIHIGHSFKNTLLFSSWMLFSFRRNLWFINLLKTIYMWKITLKFVLKCVNLRSPIWFVNLDKALKSFMEQSVDHCGEFCCTSYWTGGLLSNKEVLSYVWSLPNVRGSARRKQFFVYFKKALFFSRKSWPRFVFVSSLNHSYPCVKEALSSGLYCAAIVDTDTRSQAITLPIPGNDSNLLSIVFYIKVFTSYILLNKFFLVFGWYTKVRTSSRLIRFRDWLLTVKFRKLGGTLKMTNFLHLFSSQPLVSFLKGNKRFAKVPAYAKNFSLNYSIFLLKDFDYYNRFFSFCDFGSYAKLSDAFRADRSLSKIYPKFFRKFSKYKKPNWLFFIENLWFFDDLGLDPLSKNLMYFSLLYMFKKSLAFKKHFRRFKNYFGTTYNKKACKSYLKVKSFNRYLFFKSYLNLTIQQALLVTNKKLYSSHLWFSKFLKQELKRLLKDYNFKPNLWKAKLMKKLKLATIFIRKKIWKKNKKYSYYEFRNNLQIIKPMKVLKVAPVDKISKFFVGNWILKTSVDIFFWINSVNYFSLNLNFNSGKFFYFWRFLFLKKVELFKLNSKLGPAFLLFFFNNWFFFRYKGLYALRSCYNFISKKRPFFFCFTANTLGVYKWRGLSNSFLYYYNWMVIYHLFSKNYGRY